MRFVYDRAIDRLSIEIQPEVCSEIISRVADGVHLVLTRDERIVRITIANASQRIPVESLEHIGMTIEAWAREEAAQQERAGRRRRLTSSAPQRVKERVVEYQVERMFVLELGKPDVVYLVTPEGERWRVHDLAERGIGFVRVLHASRRAKHRAFVAANGRRRLYSFAHRERKEISPAHLERQLRVAAEIESPTTSLQE